MANKLNGNLGHSEEQEIKQEIEQIWVLEDMSRRCYDSDEDLEEDFGGISDWDMRDSSDVRRTIFFTCA